MDEVRGLAKLLFDPLTRDILQLATSEGLYPNQIARKIGKSNSLVVKKLRGLEKHGIVSSSYTTIGGKAVKRYALSDEELLFRIDLRSGDTQIQKKRSSPLYEIVKKHASLFDGYENYLLWTKGKVSRDEFSRSTGLAAQDAEDVMGEIRSDVEGVFLTAYFQKLRNWKESLKSAYLDFVEDYVVIPTHRLKPLPGLDATLINKLSKGETFLSTLKEEVPLPDLEARLKELEKMKMLVLEEKHFPRIAFDKVIELAKSTKESSGSAIEATLYGLGKDTGKNLARFLPDTKAVQTAFKALFGAVRIEKASDGKRVIFPNCRICKSLDERRACHFISGLMESVLETHGLKVTVMEEKSRIEKHSCIFSINLKTDEDVVVASEKLKALFGE